MFVSGRGQEGSLLLTQQCIVLMWPFFIPDSQYSFAYHCSGMATLLFTKGFVEFYGSLLRCVTSRVLMHYLSP